MNILFIRCWGVWFREIGARLETLFPEDNGSLLVRTCQRSLCTSMTSLEGSDLGTMRYFLCTFRLGGVARESTDMRIPLALLSVRSTSLLSFGRGVTSTSPSFRLKPPPAAFGCCCDHREAACGHRPGTDIDVRRVGTSPERRKTISTQGNQHD